VTVERITLTYDDGERGCRETDQMDVVCPDIVGLCARGSVGT
jgi:hypothetical protein